MGAEAGLPAEYYSRLYMKQAWGGSQRMAYRTLLAVIGRELASPLTRCPECEEPYVPILLSWPCRSRPGKKTLRRRYTLCPYCGYRHHFNNRGWSKRPIFTPEQLEEIIELYQLEVSPQEIARRMGCHPGTVRNYVRRAGIPMRPQGGSQPLRGIPHQDLETVRFLYENLGWTQAQVAAYMRMHEGRIQTWVRNGGMHRFGKVPKRRPQRKSQGTSSTASNHLEKVAGA